MASSGSLPKSAKAYRALLPRLTDDNYDETSEFCPKYNCIGHAAGTKQWWEPIVVKGFNAYWPASAPKTPTMDAYISAYASIGYVVCDSDAPEEGFEKVALFAKAGKPTHAALQLSDGRWTSKLGQYEDIAHQLHDVSCPTYGSASVYLKRPK